jgi:hypothetical protein
LEIAHIDAPLDAPDCPLCGQPNRCQAVAAGHFDDDCWCMPLMLDPRVLDRASDRTRAACLCQRCATHQP